MITAYAMEWEPRLFVALLGRAADGVEFATYAYAFEAEATLDQIANWMYYEYEGSDYAGMTHAQIAAKFYANVYGRAPDAAALALWQGRLDAWQPPSEVLVDMVEGLVNYGGTDAATLASRSLFLNKSAVVMYYAEWGGNPEGVDDVLDGVTADGGSVLEAIHAMKGHYNIPADASDPAPGPNDPGPAPAPAPAPEPAPEPAPAPAPAPQPGPAPAPAPEPPAPPPPAEPPVKNGLPDHAEDLAALYLAYFGRPMDWAGMDFYLGHGPIDVIALAPYFSASPESQALYGTTFGAAQVNAIYNNLFNRDAEAGGIAFWTDAVNSGKLTPAEAAMNILIGAHVLDKQVVDNKLQAALLFAEHVDTQSEVAGYSGAQAAAVARQFLQAVDGTPESLADAVAHIDEHVAAAVQVQVVGVAYHQPQ